MNSDVFTKHAPPSCPLQPRYEAAGLAWLEDGGAPVPQVLAVTDATLTTRRLKSAAPTPRDARKLGRNLARVHASGAPNFGAPPRGYSGPGYMGLAKLPLLSPPPADADHWGSFYANYRILPYLDSTFNRREETIIETLIAALRGRALDHPQPSLVEEKGHTAARTHGDLWSGNIMWTPEGAYLIDPAAQGGHAEEDIAALTVFSAPYFEQIVEGYQQVSTFSPLWRERIPLHQMHILMVHCYLFGRSYVPQTVAAAKAALEIAK